MHSKKDYNSECVIIAEVKLHVINFFGPLSLKNFSPSSQVIFVPDIAEALGVWQAQVEAHGQASCAAWSSLTSA